MVFPILMSFVLSNLLENFIPRCELFWFFLTPYLLVSSAGNLCKELGSKPDPTKRRTWSGPKLFGTLMVFLKSIETVDLEATKSAGDKNMKTTL